MKLKGKLFDKFLVFKRKTSIFLDKLESAVIKVRDWFNKLITNVLDIIALLKDIVGLKIENHRINKIVKLEIHIGKIKAKIGYQ